VGTPIVREVRPKLFSTLLKWGGSTLYRVAVQHHSEGSFFQSSYSGGGRWPLFRGPDGATFFQTEVVRSYVRVHKSVRLCGNIVIVNGMLTAHCTDLYRWIRAHATICGRCEPGQLSPSSLAVHVGHTSFRPLSREQARLFPSRGSLC
jgi:hypothetical protein